MNANKPIHLEENMAQQRTLRELLTTYHQSREQTESLAKQSWTLALDMLENAMQRLNTLSAPAAHTASDTVNTAIHPRAHSVLNYMNQLQHPWILMFYAESKPGNTIFLTNSDKKGEFKYCRRDVSKLPENDVTFYDYRGTDAGDIINRLLHEGRICAHILAKRTQIGQLVIHGDNLLVVRQGGGRTRVKFNIIA